MSYTGAKFKLVPVAAKQPPKQRQIIEPLSRVARAWTNKEMHRKTIGFQTAQAIGAAQGIKPGPAGFTVFFEKSQRNKKPVIPSNAPGWMPTAGNEKARKAQIAKRQMQNAKARNQLLAKQRSQLVNQTAYYANLSGAQPQLPLKPPGKTGAGLQPPVYRRMDYEQKTNFEKKEIVHTHIRKTVSTVNTDEKDDYKDDKKTKDGKKKSDVNMLRYKEKAGGIIDWGIDTEDEDKVPDAESGSESSIPSSDHDEEDKKDQEIEEIQTKQREFIVRDLNRDVLCWSFESRAKCRYGSKCQWLHVNPTTGIYKKTLYVQNEWSKDKLAKLDLLPLAKKKKTSKNDDEILDNISVDDDEVMYMSDEDDDTNTTEDVSLPSALLVDKTRTATTATTATTTQSDNKDEEKQEILHDTKGKDHMTEQEKEKLQEKVLKILNERMIEYKKERKGKMELKEMEDIDDIDDDDDDKEEEKDKEKDKEVVVVGKKDDPEVVRKGSKRYGGYGVSFDSEAVCWEFNSINGCKKGSKCRWHHEYLATRHIHPYTGVQIDGLRVRKFRIKNGL